MRTWISLVVAAAVAVVSTFAWLVSIDGDSGWAVVGLAGSAGISWLLVHGAARRATPAVTPAPFTAPPGTAAVPKPAAAVVAVAGLAHAGYAYNLALFLGADVFWLDGDASASGAVWLIIMATTCAHAIQAVAMPWIARAASPRASGAPA